MPERGPFRLCRWLTRYSAAFRPAIEPTWFGMIASTQSLERARDGAFAARLLRLLREGPLRTSRALLRWSPHNELISGDDLIVTLDEEWDFETQRPKITQLGLPRPLLPNPLFKRQAPERVVEHLLLAARGIGPGGGGLLLHRPRRAAGAHRGVPSSGPRGNHGRDRTGRLRQIGRGRPRRKPVEHRRARAAHCRLPSGARGPGEGSVHAHVHARSLTVEQVVQAIDEQLVSRGLLPPNQAGPRNRGDLLGRPEAERPAPSHRDRRPDEAGQAAWQIADDVLRLLAPVAKVLVGTRELTAPDGGTSLIQRLAAGDVVDLGEESLCEGHARGRAGIYWRSASPASARPLWTRPRSRRRRPTSWQKRGE